jgi:hypothetical protein
MDAPEKVTKAPNSRRTKNQTAIRTKRLRMTLMSMTASFSPILLGPCAMPLDISIYDQFLVKTLGCMKRGFSTHFSLGPVKT